MNKSALFLSSSLLLVGLASQPGPASAQYGGQGQGGYHWGVEAPQNMFPRGSTVYGDHMRGIGAMYYGMGSYYRGLGAGQGMYAAGMGQYAHGMAAYTEALARAEYYRESARALAADRTVREAKAAAKRAETHRHERKERTKKHRARELARFRDYPGPQTVTSGKTLNFLLVELGSHAKYVDSSDRVTPADLSRLQLRVAATGGLDAWESVLDRAGKINWPAGLHIEALRREREWVDRTMSSLVQILRNGQTPPPAGIEHMERALVVFHERAGQQLAHRSMALCCEARSFLSTLRRAVHDAGTEGVRRQFDGTLDYRADSVQDLLAYMLEYNLRFAPADPTAGSSYDELHGIMAAAHRTLEAPELAMR